MHQVHCSAKRTTGLVVYCFLGQVVRVTTAQRVGIPEKTTINQILKKLNWVQRLHHLTTTHLSGHLLSLWCKRGHNGFIFDYGPGGPPTVANLQWDHTIPHTQWPNLQWGCILCWARNCPSLYSGLTCMGQTSSGRAQSSPTQSQTYTGCMPTVG